MKEHNPITDEVVSSIEDSFNYAYLDVETRLVVQQCTSEIKERMRRAAEGYCQLKGANAKLSTRIPEQSGPFRLSG